MQGPKPMKSAALAIAFAFAALVPGASVSDGRAVAQDPSGFSNYLVELGNLAVSRGVKRSTVDAVMPSLTYNARAVALDRAQPGGTPNGPIPKFAPYRARHVDAARIGEGRVKYQALRGLLAKVERETGVPESIMVAIWGHETNYGKVKGTYDLAEALATLAYEGRRRQLFADEFVAVLKMMDRGYPRWKLKGSWAGATGHPQFLPSMYLRLGKDGDGDGRADIWDSEADALASIANYFVNAGWRRGMTWGVPASVPDTLDRVAIANRTISPRCPKVHDRHSRWKTVAEWRALGVVPQRPGLRDGDMASFFQPDGPNTPAWLLTGNYRVILDYNCSNFYALSVGLLSDAVGS
jgi:membrane-bound lytic murein transglycosylase B